MEWELGLFTSSCNVAFLSAAILVQDATGKIVDTPYKDECLARIQWHLRMQAVQVVDALNLKAYNHFIIQV